MTLRSPRGHTGTVLAATATILAVATPPAFADAAGKLFTGAGRGLLPQSAIFGAISDPEASAAAEQLSTCTLYGEPEVFRPDDHPVLGQTFRAQATVSCTP